MPKEVKIVSPPTRITRGSNCLRFVKIKQMRPYNPATTAFKVAGMTKARKADRVTSKRGTRNTKTMMDRVKAVSRPKRSCDRMTTKVVDTVMVKKLKTVEHARFILCGPLG